MSTQETTTMNHRVWYKIMNDVVFVVPEGAGDQSCAEELQQVFEDLSRDGHKSFVLDLSHLRYFESPGFRLIVNKLCELQRVGGSLVVTGLRGVVARAFNLLRLGEFVPVASDAVSAIALAKTGRKIEPIAG